MSTDAARHRGPLTLAALLERLAPVGLGLFAYLAWQVGQRGVHPVVVMTALILVALAGSAAVLLVVRPCLVPWAVIPLFCLTQELQLRVAGPVGASKDLLTLLLAAQALVMVSRSPQTRGTLRDFRAPLGFLAVCIAFYLLNPAGSPLLGWVFGARLFVQASLLFLIGLLAREPLRTLRHGVGAVTVMALLEAVFSLMQQAAGPRALVYEWGYAFGSQVRLTSSGGTRVSGTFGDPFQLMALGVLAAVVAAFLAHGWRRWLLLGSVLAITAATSVRTALVQLAAVVVLMVLRRGWRSLAATAGLFAVSAGLVLGLSVSTAEYPGAPEKPLLLGLNGRTTAWSLAVKGPESLIMGNGVGAVGVGSTRGAQGLITKASKYNPKAESKAAFAGDNAFLDSAYLQVQSDIGIVGSLAFLAYLGSLASWIWRRLRTSDAAWAAAAVLATSAIDWVGRSSYASYSTGFLTLYLLGLCVAAAREEGMP